MSVLWLETAYQMAPIQRLVAQCAAIVCCCSCYRAEPPTAVTHKGAEARAYSYTSPATVKSQGGVQGLLLTGNMRPPFFRKRLRAYR